MDDNGRFTPYVLLPIIVFSGAIALALWSRRRFARTYVHFACRLRLLSRVTGVDGLGLLMIL